MLRRPIKDRNPTNVRKRTLSKSDKPSRRTMTRPDDPPLGSKKSKTQTEKVLETLVLGGEDDIIQELKKATEKQSANNTNKKTRLKRDDKVPAWEDEDDDHGCVNLTADRKFASITRGEEKKIAKAELNQRLKSQFEKVTSTPNWAKLPGEREKNSDDDDSEVEDLLQSTGTYLTSSTHLAKGTIQVKQCTDLNKEYPLKNKVKALEFHPSAQVALTGGMNNTLALFQVDGKMNPKIQSIYMDNFPIYCAHFTRDGQQVILGSKHKSFKYFDMMSGQVVNIPVKGTEDNCMMYFEVSPDGRYLVFLGKYGRMHFISAKSKEFMFTLTMNGEVSSISFTNDGLKMFSFGDQGQVYVWDLQTRDCVHKFMDEGCTQGTSLAVSPNNQYLACGSSTGVVNLYETDTCLSKFEPRPLKAIMNLMSSCTLTKFNATSEILAIASREEEKAVKLVHVSSQSVFSNFPERMDNSLRIPVIADFSVNSGYMTIGNHKGRALLYRLKHYGNY